MRQVYTLHQCLLGNVLCLSPTTLESPVMVLLFGNCFRFCWSNAIELDRDIVVCLYNLSNTLLELSEIDLCSGIFGGAGGFLGNWIEIDLFV